MCGIAGFLTPSGADGEDILRRMSASLSHRGPDDSGIWQDPVSGIGFAHARLSIIDLSSAGHQPMRSRTGRFVITYNGEIYNYLALRKELSERSSPQGWRGHSDTETLLAGFESWGIRGTLERAVGMFAMAVWDTRTRTLTLVRDRLGEKPLYYGWQGGTLLFGSELKAVRQHPAFSAELDPDALAAFLRFGYVPAPLSIHRGIKKLPAGSLIEFGPSDAEPERYWSLAAVARAGVQSPFAGSDAEAIQELQRHLAEAIRLQQVSDVPLGALLSGGIDSSLVVALMRAESTGPVHTFTIGTHGGQYDEASYAKAVARHLGTNHTEMYVTAEEAQAVIPQLPTLYDEPFADSSQIPTHLVSRLARSKVTVALSGDGGDELFGGYNRYLHAGRFRHLPRFWRRALASGLDLLSGDQWDRLHRAARPLLPTSVHSSLPGEHARKLSATLRRDSDAGVYEQLVSIWEAPPSRYGRPDTGIGAAWDELASLGPSESRMMALDAVTYLADDILCKVDRAAMGVSLETRVPFLDHRVVEFAWQLPLEMKIRHGRGKWILRALLDRFVPQSLIDRPKMGFGIPIGSWLRGPLRGWAEALLSDAGLRADGYLDARVIRQAWSDHLDGKNREHQLWNVLMFQAWLAHQGVSSPPTAVPV